MQNGVPLDVSVLICAYTEKRWDDLVAAVVSVQQQRRLPKAIILVIDHNPALFTRAQSRFQDVTVLENREAKGLSGARNTGVAAAHQPLIAFLDDDAVAEPDWLEWLSHPLDDARVLGSGGRVEPNWETGRPAWFPEEFDWVVGCTHKGTPTQTGEVRNPIGSSMCIRRQVFEVVGGFRSEIGRIGTLPLGCEETELSIRARQQWPQGKFIYEPRSRVHHHVPAARIRWSYFQARCYAEGISKAIVSRLVGANDGLSSERTHAFKTLPNAVWENIRAVFVQRDVRYFSRAVAIVAGLAFATLGYVRGSLAARSNNSPAPTLQSIETA